MDRHRTPQTSDRHEQVDEFRFCAQQLRELVENNEQGRHGRELMLARQAIGLVIRHIGVVAGLAQDLLTPHHLAAQRLLHTIHQRELRLQVRDHGRDVRQVSHASEGGAALEVDQDEVQLFW